MYGVLEKGVNRQKMQTVNFFRCASVDEVDAEEMQNQTTKDIIRESSVLRVRHVPGMKRVVCVDIPFM